MSRNHLEYFSSDFPSGFSSGFPIAEDCGVVGSWRNLQGGAYERSRALVA